MLRVIDCAATLSMILISSRYSPSGKRLKGISCPATIRSPSARLNSRPSVCALNSSGFVAVKMVFSELSLRWKVYRTSTSGLSPAVAAAL